MKKNTSFVACYEKCVTILNTEAAQVNFILCDEGEGLSSGSQRHGNHFLAEGMHNLQAWVIVVVFSFAAKEPVSKNDSFWWGTGWILLFPWSGGTVTCLGNAWGCVVRTGAALVLKRVVT